MFKDEAPDHRLLCVHLDSFVRPASAQISPGVGWDGPLGPGSSLAGLAYPMGNVTCGYILEVEIYFEGLLDTRKQTQAGRS